ncbi:MAG TPA: SBBP repeat-containing protein, partial [Chloroflexia bacterium]|nr:SBBP repeat-containing protein [Chloroflexia bacterium]
MLSWDTLAPAARGGGTYSGPANAGLVRRAPGRTGTLLLAWVVMLSALAPLAGSGRLGVEPVGGVAALPRAELSKLPMLFEPNAGQVEPSARFVAHTAGGTFLFGEAGVTLNLVAPRAEDGDANGQANSIEVGVRCEGRSPQVELAAGKGAAGKVNYLLGSDPTRWRTGVSTHSEVRYNGLYPGVDLSYEGTGGFLKGTYTVAPGTDPDLIRWRYTGAENLALNAGGDLEITLSGQSEEAALTEQAPVAWQETVAGRVPVAVSYKLLPGGSVGFNIGVYDPARPLVIDPTITYATYYGGVGDDVVTDMAIDTAGSIYITGHTTSFNLPVQSPFQGQMVSPQPYVADAFVMKLNPMGNEVVYATYLGGSEHDGANGIAVGAAGNAYVTGFTRSTDFPTKNPLRQATRGAQDNYFDVFVTELDNTGTGLVYSTYLGHYGDERGYGIAVDGSGSVYITGETTGSDYVTRNPIQPHNFGFMDAFVTKLSPLGKGVVYSTFLGGKELDRGARIKVDAAGNAYVVGSTESDNFPTKNPLQPRIGGADDVFIAKLNPQGSALVYSTYYGGSGSDGRIFFGIMLGMALDRAGNVYFTGWTDSGDLPTRNAIQPHITP